MGKGGLVKIEGVVAASIFESFTPHTLPQEPPKRVSLKLDFCTVLDSPLTVTWSSICRVNIEFNPKNC